MTRNHITRNHQALGTRLGPLGLVCGLTLGLSVPLVIAARLTGLIDATLPLGFAWTLLLAATTLAALTRACHLLGDHRDIPRPITWAVAVVPALSLIILARAFTFASLAEFTTFLLWLTILTEEAITLTIYVPAITTRQEAAANPPARQSAGSAASKAPSENTEETSPPTPEAQQPVAPSPEATTLDTIALEPTPQLSAETTQQLTRTLVDGEDAYHGLLRLSLERGQRHAYLHVAFCPPFAQVPEAELLQLEGPEASLTPGQIECHGARFDIKLRQPASSDTECLFELFASAPAEALSAERRQAG